MDDSHSMEFSLDSIWRALSNRAAAGVASMTALCALVSGAPVRIACFRGAIAWAGILVISRMFGYALHEPQDSQVEAKESSNAISK